MMVCTVAKGPSSVNRNLKGVIIFCKKERPEDGLSKIITRISLFFKIRYSIIHATPGKTGNKQIFFKFGRISDRTVRRKSKK
jgi:hypothetical protein